MSKKPNAYQIRIEETYHLIYLKNWDSQVCRVFQLLNSVKKGIWYISHILSKNKINDVKMRQ